MNFGLVPVNRLLDLEHHQREEARLQRFLLLNCREQPVRGLAGGGAVFLTGGLAVHFGAHPELFVPGDVEAPGAQGEFQRFLRRGLDEPDPEVVRMSAVFPAKAGRWQLQAIRSMKFFMTAVTSST